MDNITPLTSCCYFFSLRTGTKIIGYLQILASVIYLAVAIWLFYLLSHPDDAAEIETGELAVAVGVFLLIIAMVQIVLAAMLLVGVHQNKENLVQIWIIVFSICFVINFLQDISSMIQNNPSDSKVFITLSSLIINFYCIMVVHSFRKQMHTSRGIAAVPDLPLGLGLGPQAKGGRKV